MIYTGYWAKVKEYEKHNLVPVGISGWIPDGYNGKTYKKLAPKYVWWKEWHDGHLSERWYIDKYYETVLKTLDPLVVYQELQQFGKDVILLCFETPEKFCHRHLVAQWLNKTNKQNIEEYMLQSKQTQIIL